MLVEVGGCAGRRPVGTLQVSGGFAERLSTLSIQR